ncbi:MAG: SulP family inorganic anion transporter [Planctomycetota bacterium]
MFAHLRNDIPSSIVVFFVAVPLCLGIALASGAPLVSGLIAGIVGGIIVGAISGSPLGVSGPAAGLAVIVLTSIQDVGSFELFLVAVVIGGVVQVILGLARAGVLGYFFPSSVIKGMLSGIGVLIILKQIPHAVGHDSDPEGDMSFVQPDGDTTLSALTHMMDDLSLSAVIVSSVSLAILILWERVLMKRGRFFKIVQGPIVAVAFGILYEVITTRYLPDFALSREHLVDVPVAGSIAAFAQSLTHPDWAGLSNSTVWLAGFTIAIVASLETLLCVEATDKLDPQKRVTPTNRELIAQGVGNMSSGLIGGLPVTQVIVRSSANIQSGGQTKLSAILHGVLLFVFVIAIPQVLNLIPLAALAAILFVVGYKLAKPALFRQMYGLGMAQFVPFLTTILGIVFTDLLTGIALGMAVALFVILRNHYLNSHFLHIQEKAANGEPHQVTMELAEEITFLNKGALIKELASIPDGSRVRIDATNTVRIDHDILEIIADFEASSSGRGITVEKVGDFETTTRPRQARVSVSGDPLPQR